MTKALVECVPNFSEGRDRAVIQAIAEAISAVQGVTVLDVDPGADTHRTVVTCVGAPEAMLEGIFHGMKVAVQRIDMQKHRGAHARLGAVDVTPFVPVAGITMQECVELARRLGERVGRELGVPVYLYEEAATCEQRRNLADVRAGEYEGLAKKLADPEWKPDFGPTEFVPRSGAFVIGARKFLIAYNINLNTRDAKLANEIALNLREHGRLKRDAQGNKVMGPDGVAQRVPGKLKNCKAVGWYIDDYKQAQISMNLTDYHVTPVHVALEAARQEAQRLGLVVTGSELVGLIPKEAMLDAGRYYLQRQGRSWGVSESELIATAVVSMGLSQLAPFDPRKKIIELQVAPQRGKLVQLQVGEFVDECSSESPAPGGGSVAALAGSMGAGLVAMVANLTVGKKGYEAAWERMKHVAHEAQLRKEKFLVAVDRDTEAFDAVMAAMRLPKATAEQREQRDAAMQEATKQATLVPFEVLSLVPEVMALAEEVVQQGNQNSLSDAGVAVQSLRLAADGAWLNVQINLRGLTDPGFREDLKSRGKALITTIEQEAQRLSGLVQSKLEQ